MVLGKGYLLSLKRLSHRAKLAGVIPNPFYQIYEARALLANVEPLLVPATESTEHLANYRLLTDDDWQRCEMLFLYRLAIRPAQ